MSATSVTSAEMQTLLVQIHLPLEVQDDILSISEHGDRGKEEFPSETEGCEDKPAETPTAEEKQAQEEVALSDSSP